MLRKFVKGKVYIFIDVSNVYFTKRTLGWQVGYEKFMKYLKKECGKDIKCFAYTAFDDNSLSQRKFIDMLDINGYIVRTKAVKDIQIKGGISKRKGNLDMELGLEMVDLAERYGTAILVSGDSDFAVPHWSALKEKANE